MAVTTTGNTYSTGDQVTAATQNAQVNSATFASGAVDNSTTQLSGGAIIVKDGGITPQKLSSGAPSWATSGATTFTKATGGISKTSASSNATGIYDAYTVNGTSIGFVGTADQLVSGSSASDFGLDANSGDLVLATNATRRVTIDNSTGNVGINESDPDYKLDVNGSFGFTPGSSVTPADNGDVVIEATNNTTLTFKLKGSDGTVRSATLTLA